MSEELKEMRLENKVSKVAMQAKPMSVRARDGMADEQIVWGL